VRGNDREPLLARDARQERHERPGAGIREVEVLEDEDHRMLFAEPAEQPQDPLEGPGLAALRRRRAAVQDRGARLDETWAEIGQQAHDLRRCRAEEVDEDVGRYLAERRADGTHEGAVRLVRVGRPGGRAQDRHRLAESLQPRDRLIEEARDSDARGPIEEHRPCRAARRLVQRHGQTRERVIATDEPRARVPGGHGRILRAGHHPDTPPGGPSRA
jgi:hypothetical protein